MTTLLSSGGRPCACYIFSSCLYYSIFVAFWAFDCTEGEQCREGPIDIKTGIKTGLSVQQCIVSRRKPQLYMMLYILSLTDRSQDTPSTSRPGQSRRPSPMRSVWTPSCPSPAHGDVRRQEIPCGQTRGKDARRIRLRELRGGCRGEDMSA